MSVTLKDKFLGCIAGSFCGSAMGAPYFGKDYVAVAACHGGEEGFLPYSMNGWDRTAGTTESGIERLKMLAEAIIAKEDRVWVEDVRKAWLSVYTEDAMDKMLESFDKTLYAIAKTTVPGRDIGKYCDYSAFISFPGSCMPIGLINAGNMETVDADILNVGQLYQVSNSRGIRWAQLVGGAIAAATKPDATVKSVISAVVALPMDKMMKGETPRHLKATEHMTPEELPEYFNQFYNGEGIKFVFHSANEIVTKALCVLQVCNGNVEECIKTGIKLGRGTAATAALAGALAGAVSGASGIPQEWMTKVDEATMANPYTCVRKSIKETADALYGAYVKKMEKETAFVTMMDIE